MKLMPLDKLGARELPDNRVHFGIYLPWISATFGNRLYVKIIHEQDQFLQLINPKSFELQHALDSNYSDYWSTEITINPSEKPHSDSAWGSPGRYVYRFCLHNPNVSHDIDWIVDPFAREFGVGKLSAFTLGYTPYIWSDNETTWKTPKLSDLVIYELMIAEFGNDVDSAIAKLDYLADLGVNCLEIMPVSNVSNTIDWGFLPIGYFGVDERFGKRKDMQHLVDMAHQRGIAVIFDVVYGHSSSQFTYAYVYQVLNYHENPVMGPFAKDYFGVSTDWNRSFTCDFFFTVNYHWLDCYHADGFRYDCVPNYYDGPMGVGYSSLIFQTYKLIKDKLQTQEHWQRFQGIQKVNLIQCAEQLEGPVEIVEKTYSNCTWQNETQSAAQNIAAGYTDALTDFGHRLGLLGYPETVKNDLDSIDKSALQYLENHDHQRFVCNFGLLEKDNILIQEGDRSKWYKLQPYVLGMLLGKGIPLIWQGQEFGENYFVPYNGWGRVMLLRPVRWDYFYDPIGRSMIALFRKALSLRQAHDEFRLGEHYFYNHYDNYQSKGVLLFHRILDSRFSLVALNFSDSDQWVPYSFPKTGKFTEMLHGLEDTTLNLDSILSGETKWLQIPSNYGRIWSSDGL